MSIIGKLKQLPKTLLGLIIGTSITLLVVVTILITINLTSKTEVTIVPNEAEEKATKDFLDSTYEKAPEIDYTFK